MINKMAAIRKILMPNKFQNKVESDGKVVFKFDRMEGFLASI